MSSEYLIGKQVKISVDNGKKYSQNYLVLEETETAVKVIHEDLIGNERCEQWKDKSEIILQLDNGTVRADDNRSVCSSEYIFKDDVNRITVEDYMLKLYDKSSKPIPEWKPTRNVKPFDEVKKIYCDIETSGLNPEVDRIYYIGLKLSGYSLTQYDSYELITNKSEKKLLERFVQALRTYKPEILSAFNGFKFDLPFVIRRCEILKVSHDFKVSDYQVTVRTAQLYGDAESYNNIYLKIKGCSTNTSIVDIYHQVLIWDNVRRILTSHSLKQSVIQMGLRPDTRLELDVDEINDCWESNDLAPIEEYLKYDLDDTELLTEYLLPSIYYQQIFVPKMDVQRLASAGNATKWQLVLESQYPEIGQGVIQPDAPCKYQGGYTIGHAGLHRNVSKVDVSSLYPSIMLTYHITSEKDSEFKALGILKYLLEERLRLKKLAKTDKQADQKQGALKILINSLYGLLGTKGIGYNDYTAAALVTAYGRRIAELMITVIEMNGGKIVEVDTDGVMFSAMPGRNNDIFQCVKNSMPSGIQLEHEWQATAVYIPPVGKGKIQGVSKNYLVFLPNGKVKATGRFRKRDVCKLERDFQTDYLKKYLISPTDAENYFKETITAIQSGNYDIEKLSIKRKIRKREIDLLKLGHTGKVVNFYQTDSGKSHTGDYSIAYYQDKITKIRNVLLDVIDPDLLKLNQSNIEHKFINNNSVQLSLFSSTTLN